MCTFEPDALFLQWLAAPPLIAGVPLSQRPLLLARPRLRCAGLGENLTAVSIVLNMHSPSVDHRWRPIKAEFLLKL